MAERQAALEIQGTVIEPGTSRRVDLPVARLPAGTMMTLPVRILHGLRPGPCVWLSSTIHGDEVNGVEIIRRVTRHLALQTVRGTLFAVPIVNVFGFIQESRYLPDRRDLNRSFPGSPTGSLAARLAHLFMEEIVSRCSHGIDLHTGSLHRINYPHVRVFFDDPESLRCAEAFGARFLLDAKGRGGTLREAARDRGKHCLVYEGGETLRFNPITIEHGVRGVLGVLATLGTHRHRFKASRSAPLRITETRWVRARTSGILRLGVSPGEEVQKGQTLGTLSDAFGDDATNVTASWEGIVIGLTQSPLVHRGDGLFHIGLPGEKKPKTRPASAFE